MKSLISHNAEGNDRNRINESGKGTVQFAGLGIQKSWSMKREMLSPTYTTRYY
ncbi:DUF4113 domain-containing protein [Yersinia enterocolitica]|nr:DUF4113 domain-containing protein [Yersinia enterocolitica]